MNSTSFRKGLIVLAAAVGGMTAGMIGCCSTRSPRVTVTTAQKTPCDHLPHDNVILVEDNKVSCDEAYVSKAAQNSIDWIAPGHKLEIRFVGITPFEHLICGGSACSAFIPSVEPSDSPYKYEVWVDKVRVLDPNIIIKP